MKKESSLIKSTFIIMIVSLISRIIGFVRDMLIAKNFGAGMYTDAYNIAVTIPETIFTLIGLAISTAFLPMLSKIRSQKGHKEMYNFANNVINILFIISLTLFVVSNIFAKEIVSVLANGFSPEATMLAIRLTKITLLNLLFLSINACFTALLQINEDFVIPSILGLFFNLPMIVYLLLFKNYDIVGLTVANVIGNLFRVLAQIPSLLKHNYRYRFIVNFKDERLKDIVILIIPVIIGAGANSLNMIVDKNIASSLEIGTISALDYAQKLIIFINSIIVTSITNVVYPMMTNRRNEGDESGFIDILKKSLVYLGILLIPITIGMIIFNKEIVSIVYERGEFNNYALRLTSLALVGYSIGIFFTGIRDILNSMLFSMGKTKITTINGIIGVIINISLSIILSKTLGIIGVALASSIAMFITSVLLMINIKRLKEKFTIKDILVKINTLAMNSIIMGLVIVLLNSLLKNILPSMIRLGLGTMTGAIVYFILCYLFKFEEVIEMKNLVLNKLRK